jgi:hypothetical protein
MNDQVAKVKNDELDLVRNQEGDVERTAITIEAIVCRHFIYPPPSPPNSTTTIVITTRTYQHTKKFTNTNTSTHNKHRNTNVETICRGFNLLFIRGKGGVRRREEKLGLSCTYTSFPRGRKLLEIAYYCCGKTTSNPVQTSSQLYETRNGNQSKLLFSIRNNPKPESPPTEHRGTASSHGEMSLSCPVLRIASYTNVAVCCWPR